MRQAPWQPDPADSRHAGAPRVLVRCDSAGATHTFAEACRGAGVGFSFGHPVDAASKTPWTPSTGARAGIRPPTPPTASATGRGLSATTLVDLSAWPVRTRLLLRKERPHPGAQLRFTDADGMRATVFITDTPPGVVPGQLAGPELGTASTPASRTASAN